MMAAADARRQRTAVGRTAHVQINRLPVRLRSQLRAHYGAGVAQRVRSDRLEDRTVIGIGAASLVIEDDLLQRFEDERTDPDANVGGANVHQAEAGEHFEAMDVELIRENCKKKKKTIYVCRNIYYSYTFLLFLPANS